MDMDPNEMLLVLTICKLLGHTPTAQDVQNAYSWANRQIDKQDQSPREPKVTYGPRHE
jgi:hypothetical protein